VRSKLSAINDRLEAGAVLVVVSGPPGSGKTHILNAWAGSRGLQVEDLGFMRLDLERVVGNVVFDNVDPEDLPLLRDLKGIANVVVSTCVSDTEHVQALPEELPAEFEEFDEILSRAGRIPGVFYAIQKVAGVSSKEEIDQWRERVGLAFLSHPLTPSLTNSSSWARVWDKVPERVKQAWRSLACLEGSFSLETALKMNGGDADSVFELLYWNVCFRVEEGLAMWPGARVFVWKTQTPDNQNEFLRVVIAQGHELRDFLEYGFMEMAQRRAVKQWRENFYLAFDLASAGGVNVTEQEVLELGVTCSLLDFENLRTKACIERLEPLVRQTNPDDPTMQASFALALRVLAKALAAAGFHESAIAYARRSEAIALSKGDMKAAARATYEEICAWRASGDAQGALDAFLRGMKHAEDSNDLVEIARLKEIKAVLTHTFYGHSEAEPYHREALTLAQQAGLKALEAYIIVHLANVYWRDQDLIRARTALLSAESRQRQIGDLRALGTTLTGIATVSLDLGDTSTAREYASAASSLHRASGQTLPDAIAILLQCRVAVEEGRVLLAEQCFMEAITAVPPNVSTQWQSRVQEAEIMVAFSRNDIPRVLSVLDRVRTLPEKQLWEADLTFIEMVCRFRSGQVAQARELLAALPGQLGAHSKNVDQIVALLPIFKLVAEPEDSNRELLDDAAEAFRNLILSSGIRNTIHVEVSSRLRFWVRQLEFLLSSVQRQHLWAFALSSDKTAWLVDELMVRRPESDEWLDLSRRSVPARIFQALCQLRWVDPFALAPDSELIEEAWPGERLLADSALTRLQKAVSDLRKLGLGEIIERVENGYRLVPGATIYRVPRSFDEWWDTRRSASQLLQQIEDTRNASGQVGLYGI